MPTKAKKNMEENPNSAIKGRLRRLAIMATLSIMRTKMLIILLCPIGDGVIKGGSLV